jgi:hypothetical protein
MRRITVARSALLLVLALPTAARALHVATLDAPTALDGEWRFQPGDDPAWDGLGRSSVSIRSRTARGTA